ncbi:NIMA related kinase 1, putative [Plasmodium relictum]|uniref:non-specific serine/threonine protein kinase n=1 Tax=Plasmodium relictum TaxID=85471 RepID=A0A1J1HB33_PLARL|nr:NIMA related kinase 1, putative [Plasmodium relictum]CRH02705.1 NIMA related kinase 1, putative [Plasmodium relictum]
MPSKYDDGESRLNEYEVVKKIGNGKFGEVFLVKHKRTQEFFCWKAISYRGLKEREKSQLVIEVNVMRELKHKNIVRYIDRFLNKANQKLYILMEFCDAGDLSRNIQKCYKMFGKIEEHAIIDITRQLLHALAYCHNLKDGPNGERVLHRDLKPQNIFLSTGIRHIGKITAQANNLSGRPIAKIGDFGLSKNIGIESMAHSCVGTPYYWSPELLLHETKSYDDKSDMWALGCIIYELCSGKTPFHKANNFSQLISELKKGPELPIKGKSKELNILIKNLLNLSPKERPSALQCLGYQIIKNVTPPVIKRKDSYVELPKIDNCKATEIKPYVVSQNDLLNKGSNERERSSSCLSRQSANTITKDTLKYNQDINNPLVINGQYPNRENKKVYDIEKERSTEKEKMKRELIEREQLERNRMEKENTQRKALEIKLMEKKRLERERLERIEREKAEIIEREKIERLERERIERMERERMQRLERERLERERIERERIERERFERERLERERLERERLERIERERMERIERDKMQQRMERERIEKGRRENFFIRGIDNNNIDLMEKLRIQSKNQESYNSFSRMKEKYNHMNNFKNYMYSNMKSKNYDDENLDKCDINTYLKKNSISTISSKNMQNYSNNSTHINNNYVGIDGYSGFNNNQSTLSQYSSNSVESGKYKINNKYQVNISKNNRDLYNENNDSTCNSPRYEKKFNDINSTCKSSRISNVYFNDSARRSVSALPHMNNLSRRKSSVYMCEHNGYNKNNVEENRNFKNLEKDREYLLEKRKLLLEKEKEIYERMRQNNNYTYSTMQRYDRCENLKNMNKLNEHNNRRNRSVSVCVNEQEKKNSFRTKNKHEDDENDYILRNRNIYTLKNLVHNNEDNIYDRNLYS